MNKTSNLEKAPPPLAEDDQSTKKARFRDKSDNSPEVGSSVSFKDMLMQI